MSTAATNSERLTERMTRLTAVVDFAVASHARAVAVLVLASLLAFLPGFFSIPPLDRDEARFAQASKQMLETGDYMDIRFQDEVRYKKPVGIYWMQAGFVRAAEVLGVREAQTTIWLYRVPSLIGAVGAVLLTYWAALAFVSRRAAVLAALMMATSLGLGIEARIAKTDAMLLLTIIAAMGAMARAYLGERKPARSGIESWILPAVFWTALAAGMMLKGPVILLFVGLTIAALAIADRSLRWFLALRPIVGVIWFVLLVLPWFVVILNRAGQTFIAESVGKDMVRKLWGSQEGHGAPPGYYFLLFWVTFWPGATLAAIATPSVWAARREKGARFLLAWAVPAWIVFEIVVTKLPHYVLPVYPAIAILIAGVIDPHVLARERWLVRGTFWWVIVPVLAGIGSIALLIVLGRQLGLLAWPFAAASIIFALFAWRLYRGDRAEHSMLRACIASILLSISLFGIVMPSLSVAFPSASLARVLRASPCGPPQVASAGYQEPSLVFLVGTGTKLVDGPDAADFLRQGGCRVALIEARHERSFLRRADVIGLRYAPPQRIEGVNYSNGRSVSIAIYRAEGLP